MNNKFQNQGGAMRRKKLNPPSALDVRSMTPKDVQRFMAFVEHDPSGCWKWTGYCDQNGYGQFKLNGVAHGSHRISEALFKGGKIREGREVDHTRRCKLGASCVCPWHTRKLSHVQNSVDGAARRWEESELPI